MGEFNFAYLVFFFSSRRRHTSYWRDWIQTCALPIWKEGRKEGRRKEGRKEGRKKKRKVERKKERKGGREGGKKEGGKEGRYDEKALKRK